METVGIAFPNFSLFSFSKFGRYPMLGQCSQGEVFTPPAWHMSSKILVRETRMDENDFNQTSTSY